MSSLIEVFEIAPRDFAAKVEVAACYLEVDSKLLLLQLPKDKLESGHWGVPAGKLEAGELPIDAARRELFEETGINLDAGQILSVGILYMRKPQLDYVYHLFKVTLNAMPDIHLSDEHQGFTWAYFKQLQELPLMCGALEGLQHYRKILGYNADVLKSVLNGYCYSDEGWDK